MQIIIAGDLVQVKVRSTKMVTGKINGQACLILKQTPITQRSYISHSAIFGHWLLGKNDTGFQHVKSTFSNANKAARKIKPWFCHIALVKNLQL